MMPVSVCEKCGQHEVWAEGATLCPECIAGDKAPHLRAVEPEMPEPRPRLHVLDLDKLLEYVETRANTGWLIEGLWPGDAYGMLAAEDKAGKTWGAVDLGVSVKSGTGWLGRFACPDPGDVLMFWGEGGERAMLRRIRAVAESRGLHLADLMPGFRSCFRVPKLKDPADVTAMRDELEAFPAKLVILDPLYLAATGARGSDIFDMGAALGEVQAVCQDAGSALVVFHHWNQTGQGTGWKRMSGAGPSAWGRVLGSANVETSRTDPETMASTVTLRWEFVGGEIAPSEFTMLRRVWVDDPLDLTSAMHYEVKVTDEGTPTTTADGRKLGRTKVRTLAALGGTSREEPMSTPEIAAKVDTDGGKPYGERTYQKVLSELAALGLVRASEGEPGMARLWWLA